MISLTPKIDRKTSETRASAGTSGVGTPATDDEVSVPLAEVRPTLRAGFWPRTVALGVFLTRTEVHTYAFSVAANVILSLFPFLLLLLTVTRRVFHSRSMETVLTEVMRNFLPTGQDFVMRNMQLLAHPHKGTQIVSLFMLLVTSTGVFLPLEVALNSVWGVEKNRSYVRNQAISLLLAIAAGVLAMTSVLLTAEHRNLLVWAFLGHTQNAAFVWLGVWATKILAALASICLFFLVYWLLPNRQIPALAVLPTAITVGILWEVAKYLYVRALPWLDFQRVYGPFYISVGLMIWAFLSGLLLLAGAHFSATRYSLRLARAAEAEE